MTFPVVTPMCDPDSREARVTMDGNGDPIGAAVFLTADELADIGINPERTDAVIVFVEDGEVRIRPKKATQV